MEIVDDNLILKLENFRTKVIQVLKEKGITIDDNAKLDDALVKAIDSISTLQGLDDYITNDIVDYVNQKLTQLGAYKFYYMPTIHNVRCDAVINIGEYSLYNCSSLKHLYFPNVVSIREHVFHTISCENLILPNLKTMGSACFVNITTLKRLIIPKCISLGTSACTGTGIYLLDAGNTSLIPSSSSMPNLTILVLRRNLLTTLENRSCIQSVEEIYVPQDLIEQYKVATNWATYADKFKPLEGSKYEPLNWYEEEAWYKEEMKVWE